LVDVTAQDSMSVEFHTTCTVLFWRTRSGVTLKVMSGCGWFMHCPVTSEQPNEQFIGVSIVQSARWWCWLPFSQ
jgi:hypothetical protein